MLGFQNFNTEVISEELNTKYIDDYTLIQHKIISKTYFVKSKDEEEALEPEEYNLPKLLPLELIKENSFSETEYGTELESLLRENRSGLLDNNWVQQIREAYIASQNPIEVNTGFLLLLGSVC